MPAGCLSSVLRSVASFCAVLVTPSRLLLPSPCVVLSRLTPRALSVPRVRARACSGGKELVPVRCVNAVDGVDIADDGFDYIRSSVLCDQVERLVRPRLIGAAGSGDACVCACKDGQGCLSPDGDASSCACMMYNEHRAYRFTPAGPVLPKPSAFPSGVYECGQGCSCRSSASCHNAVVSHGLTLPLEVFRTTNRGWCVARPPRLVAVAAHTMLLWSPRVIPLG
jgi:hypothetical protein